MSLLTQRVSSSLTLTLTMLSLTLVSLIFFNVINTINASVMHLSTLPFKNVISTPENNIINTEKLFLMDEVDDFLKHHPEETKRRLGLIVDKIDQDRNNSVTVDELTHWIDFIHKDHIRRDVEREWVMRNPDQVDKLSWRL